MSLPRIPSDARVRSRFSGCLLGGAVGDALGAPVEFLDLDEIIRAFGEGGIRDYAPAYGKLGAITDDTQMTLFTAEALLSAHVASAHQGHEPDFFFAAAAAYGRWLMTQENSRLISTGNTKSSWLLQQKRLFSRRAPGATCLSALQNNRGKVTRAMNDSKGCGGVMRIAPVGMYFACSLSNERNRDRLLSNIFETGGDLASITHGHPSGYLSAGALAVIVSLVLVGKPLTEAIGTAKEELRKHASHKETLAAIEKAETLAKCRPGERNALRELGKGFVAEEALAIGIYCALGARDFEEGIILAVNHSGDSDSTGTIAGNLLGAAAGVEAIPSRWLTQLEMRSTIEAIAYDLGALPEWCLRGPANTEERAFYTSRYPVS
ncbi:MAG TPA: ADP-ribosylglycohydrolase family protein [Candidatus Acidoferrum sp.]|nr:ADP-ribosylglycohydrolase family protein [Candidatus Acidoferrum sp.]